ncbi:DUF922 domain-containing Zn-dependent protease [Allorhizobium undicola]|uniref:DUF922 domain-containing Zn-dependent protease n=1 Tax=Allorhizobium undicola TaxID=78527 RepID=UPI0004811537
MLRSALALLLVAPASVASAFNGGREVIQPYSISGSTGPELYASIGEKGPLIGQTRVIAHTTFKLTWSRDYTQDGSACVLSRAVPNLVITYTLPREPASLDRTVRSHWQAFISGITAHEKVHGQHIRTMTAEIEAASLGLRVENDPQCQKIRQELNRRLKEISDRKREKDRIFEQEEMKDGGNIQRLILALVNGG